MLVLPEPGWEVRYLEDPRTPYDERPYITGHVIRVVEPTEKQKEKYGMYVRHLVYAEWLHNFGWEYGPDQIRIEKYYWPICELEVMGKAHEDDVIWWEEIKAEMKARKKQK